MSLLILAITSLILSVLTYIRIFSWFSIIGFCLGVSIWVISRKIWQYGTQNAVVKTTIILSIIGTFANLAGIVISFVLGGLLYGGFVTF